MAESSSIRRTLRRLLRLQRFAVLATCGRRGPHACLVAFAASADGSRLAFATARGTRKYRNLAAHPRASMLIDSRPDAAGKRGQALSLAGRARELRGAEAARWRRVYARRHPAFAAFAAAGDCALFLLETDDCRLSAGVRDISAAPGPARRR